LVRFLPAGPEREKRGLSNELLRPLALAPDAVDNRPVDLFAIVGEQGADLLQDREDSA